MAYILIKAKYRPTSGAARLCCITLSSVYIFIKLLIQQGSGSGKSQLHKILKGLVVEIMKDVEFPIEDSLVCDATCAALRECMKRSSNVLITLADEYRTCLKSLKIGSQVYNNLGYIMFCKRACVLPQSFPFFKKFST